MITMECRMKMKQSSELTRPILIPMAMDSVTETERAMVTAMQDLTPHLLTQPYRSIPTAMPIQITTQMAKVD